jgi:hypothetical protein
MPNGDDDTYKERYCAYVDILGFRGLLSKLHDGSREVRVLRNLLTKIHEPFQGDAENRYGNGDFRAQSISDAVAISTAVNTDGLLHLFYVLEGLTIDLLFEGYFTRGAIVKGRLYHDAKMVFGDALVDAFHLESEVVRYPRIMVSSAVAQDVRNVKGRRYDERIRQGVDGPNYLHVLRRMTDDIKEELLRDPNVDAEESDELAYYVGIGQTIQGRFREAVDNPRHFEKVQWFARYWNSVVAENPVHGLSLVKGAGLEQPPATFG